MQRLLIIADDLTGAMDTGAYFGRLEISTIVNVSEDSLEDTNDPVYSIHAATRNLDLAQAWEAHRRIGNKVKSYRRVIAKKTDMGYRGNHGAEISGLLTGLSRQVCYLLNALPDYDAYVLQAQQYVKKKPLVESMYASDPTHKPTTSYIPDILAKQMSEKIGTVYLEDVRGPVLKEKVEALEGQNCGVIVFDAATNDDCKIIVETLYHRSDSVVWAGTLGLMQALSAVMYGDRAPLPYVESSENIRCACFSTSHYAGTERQVQLVQARGVKRVVLDMDVCFAKGAEAETDRAIQACMEANRAGSFILTQHLSPENDSDEAGRRILETMVDCARRLCMECDFDRLVIVGGETADAILKATGTKTLKVTGMPEPGVALGSVGDGPLRGKTFASKGGSVGSDEAVWKMMRGRVMTD